MTTNRLNSFAGQADPNSRGEAYRSLDARILRGEEGPLALAESGLAADLLNTEASGFARAYLWRLLISGTPFEGGRDLALGWLARHSDPHRSLAALYLLKHYPETMREVFARYEGDHDPELKYVLAQYIHGSDRDRAYRMMMDALPGASHETYDAICLEFWDSAQAKDCAELRERDRLAGGNSVFGSIAEMVEGKLRHGR